MPYIYTLNDPETGEVRYVGKTSAKLQKRLVQHVHAAKSEKTHRDKWIKSLSSRPTIELIEDVEDGLWEDRERFWISHFRTSGRLTNIADGGGVNSPAKGQDHHKAIHSREFVREAVSLFVMGFSRSVIRTMPKFKELSDKTLRAWCQKETRASDTIGIPTRREYEIALHK